MAAIVGSEIQTRLSTQSGAAGNTTAGSANSSLGKYAATTVWPGGSLHDLFDQISGSENQAGSVEYRCIFVHNTNGNNPAQNVRVSLLSEVAGGATLSIGVDPTAASTVGSAAAQALSVANETTAPAGVSFSSPTTYAAGGPRRTPRPCRTMVACCNLTLTPDRSDLDADLGRES